LVFNVHLFYQKKISKQKDKSNEENS